MKVLVLGGGGREHALCWALDRCASVQEIVCAPGNAGIAAATLRPDVDPADPAAVRELAVRERADLVVVGPEAPLVAGVADTLQAADVPVFGPTAAAARIEGSKSFAKEVMAAAGIPTAAYWAGSDADEARAALDRFGAPYVVKADGLAAGKGVRICADRAEAEAAIDAALVAGAYGQAGSTVVLEEFLDGPEISVFGVSDGQTVVPLGCAQDFKRAQDGDAGPNTGGMGAYSPVPAVDEAVLDEIVQKVLQPAATGLADRGLPYRGVLYGGLVLTEAGPKVLEFNARFGDPEAQVLLPRLRSDLGKLLLAAAQGTLVEVGPLEWDPRACVTVVLASGGYPGSYETGKPIDGLDEAALVTDAVVFHAATRRQDGRLVTAGGRVLTVSGLGPTIADARRAAYEAADRIMADFGKYKHYVTEQTKGRLAPHEMSDYFVRYTHYVVYDQKRFDQVYEWMRSWGLATGKADHASVVATF
jgi:phosphoribosylamine---glycine ligase